MAELEPRLLQILAALPWIKALPSLNLNFFFKMDINDHLPVSKGVVKTPGDACSVSTMESCPGGERECQSPSAFVLPNPGFLDILQGSFTRRLP